MKIDPKLKIKGRLTIPASLRVVRPISVALKKASWLNKLINIFKRNKHEIPAVVLPVEKEQDVQDKRPCLTRPGGDPNYQVSVEEPRREFSLRELLRK